MVEEGLMSQAQKIWLMLDDMADNDPQAYSKFIDKKITEGRLYMQPPNPHMCLQTHLQEPEKMKLFINVCSWHRVPEPKSDEDPIPICGGDFEDLEDNLRSGKCKVVAVALNPKVLEDYGLESSDSAGREAVVKLMFAFLEAMHSGIKISVKYQIFTQKITHKGPIERLQQSLMTALKKAHGRLIKDDMTELKNSFSPLRSLDTDSVMSQLGNIVVPESTNKSQRGNNEENGINLTPNVTTPAQQNNNLIEELSATEIIVRQPNHTVARGDQGLVIEIHLPGVKSVKECELEISEKYLPPTKSTGIHGLG
ncbi:PIH1 domain-containing protein 2-like isoform X2 [Tubulanus polymorphus]|uniref:PIH1 domain-containing protein 2-like isoform X2 n=1 Tax=Tubulanus polymorphus TaxID=672921 RepID=UPI003DA4171E